MAAPSITHPNSLYTETSSSSLSSPSNNCDGPAVSPIPQKPKKAKKESAIPLKNLSTSLPGPTDVARRLQHEFDTGKCECPICTEFIIPSPAAQVWNCTSCYHIYHFSCIKLWSSRPDLASRTRNESGSFPCPTCKNSVRKSKVEYAKCWCRGQSAIFLATGTTWAEGTMPATGPGRVSAGSTGIESDRSQNRNSCFDFCTRQKVCRNPVSKCVQKCTKICHPGPCTPLVCKDGCFWGSSVKDATGKPIPRGVPNSTTTDPAQIPAQTQTQTPPPPPPPPAARTTPASDDPLPTSSPSELILGMIPIILLTWWVPILIMYWATKRQEWWSRPLQYQHFTESLRGKDAYGEVVIALVYPWYALAFIVSTGCMMWEVLTTVLNLANHTVRREFLRVLFIMMALVVVCGPLVLIFAGPDTAWYDTMRNSCNGFHTRIKLDKPKLWGDYTGMPASSFSLARSGFAEHTTNSTEANYFDLSIHANSSLADTEPFRWYHRVEGTLEPDLNLVVDFDLRTHSWRMLNVPSKDGEYTLLKNGTWTSTTSKRPHARFPEINLQIPNLYFYIKKCYYQPFIKVYQTLGLSEKEIKEQEDRLWSPSNEKNVVMRTASFGHGHQHLEVCTSRNDREVTVEDHEQLEKLQIIEEDMMVTLGLFAVLRRQMQVEGRYKEKCWWWREL